jgi:uncharacterized membrane protein
MKSGWKTEIPQLAILVAMFCWAAFSWTTGPSRMPVHWGIDGQPDRWGGRFEGVLLLPLIGLALYLLLRFVPLLDPGRANYLQFSGAWIVLRTTILAFFGLLYVVMQATARGHAVPMDRVMPAGIGVLFVVIGGVLGKVRPNWFVGVRTPWTLSSKASWVRTHRLAGWLFVAAGLLTLVGGLVCPARWALGILLGSAILAGLVSTVYSWWVWKNDPDKLPPSGTTPAE